MNVIREIKDYRASYYAGAKSLSGLPGSELRASIGLFANNRSYIGVAFFHRDQATMPDSDRQTAHNTYEVHYTWEDFPQVIDILRNESPVYFRYNPQYKFGYISTGKEPVGEGELP